MDKNKLFLNQYPAFMSHLAPLEVFPSGASGVYGVLIMNCFDL
ncbi:hypothetical protein [Nostoc sp.]